ncbi:MAG: GatB/YqeY domain-containing protein [Patescibacteria group bacterium]|nr:GatB/YqeY domain-containing protein [Patescibacteria group bacterium]MBU1953288.1 GatB/YqeY domain-containing protein [Patescibacteria group bacterium]
MVIDDLRSKLVEYQKAGDTLRLGVLRFFFSQVKNKEIELFGQKKEMTDEDVFKVLRKEVKNRKEGIETCEKAGRTDLLEKEKAELGVYLEFAKLFPFDLETPNPMANRGK